MKMNRLLLICILPVLFSACNSWLDVQPEEQISEDEVFSTGNGYRNVLNGVYKSLSGVNMLWPGDDLGGDWMCWLNAIMFKICHLSIREGSIRKGLLFTIMNTLIFINCLKQSGKKDIML